MRFCVYKTKARSLSLNQFTVISLNVHVTVSTTIVDDCYNEFENSISIFQNIKWKYFLKTNINLVCETKSLYCKSVKTIKVFMCILCCEGKFNIRNY